MSRVTVCLALAAVLATAPAAAQPAPPAPPAGEPTPAAPEAEPSPPLAPMTVATPPTDEPPTLGARRVWRLVILGAGTLTWVTSEALFKDRLSPAECRWCAPTGADERVRDALVWDNTARAATLSDFSAYIAAPALVLTTFALSDAALPRSTLRFIDDVVPIAEALVYGQLITNVGKYLIGRQRPYARFAEGEIIPTPEDNLSYPSGHSSSTFSIAMAAGMVAHRRKMKLEPVIWAGGLTIAASAAYLRIAADRHYITDVMTGSALGVAFGLLIPRLTGSLPPGVQLTPTSNGAAISGAF